MYTRIVSPEMKVYWHGWQSDLATLQYHGWNISIEESIRERRYRVYIQHKNANCYGIGNIPEREIMRYYRPIDVDDIYWNNHMHNSFANDISVQIEIAQNIYLQNYNMPNFKDIQAIDAMPRYEVIENNMSLRDMRIFAPLEPAEQEIFLAEPTMEEILQMALSRQEPRQEEIRQRILKDARIKANLRLAA